VRAIRSRSIRGSRARADGERVDRDRRTAAAGPLSDLTTVCRPDGTRAGAVEQKKSAGSVYQVRVRFTKSVYAKYMCQQAQVSQQWHCLTGPHHQHAVAID